MKKFPLKGLVVGAVMATMATACVSGEKMMVMESSPGAIKAVDLIGAWVDSGAPKTGFTYTDMSGNSTLGDFTTDILPL